MFFTTKCGFPGNPTGSCRAHNEGLDKDLHPVTESEFACMRSNTLNAGLSDSYGNRLSREIDHKKIPFVDSDRELLPSLMKCSMWHPSSATLLLHATVPRSKSLTFDRTRPTARAYICIHKDEVVTFPNPPGIELAHTCVVLKVIANGICPRLPGATKDAVNGLFGILEIVAGRMVDVRRP
jgi:hypothetical protein